VRLVLGCPSKNERLVVSMLRFFFLAEKAATTKLIGPSAPVL
jgi:hypothetical protein